MHLHTCASIDMPSSGCKISLVCHPQYYINVMQETPKGASSQDVGKMLRAASENPKAASEPLESMHTAGDVISEAAAHSCDISYRSYCEKAKRQKRSLKASVEVLKGKETRSRSATPEPGLDADGLGISPLDSRNRLDVDGDPLEHPASKYVSSALHCCMFW